MWKAGEERRVWEIRPGWVRRLQVKDVVGSLCHLWGKTKPFGFLILLCKLAANWTLRMAVQEAEDVGGIQHIRIAALLDGCRRAGGNHQSTSLLQQMQSNHSDTSQSSAGIMKLWSVA